MPLPSGRGAKVRSEIIAELIKAGHDPKQAEAIAYKQAGEDNRLSSREYDMNSFFMVKGNPISKSGIFPYSGAQIGGGLDPAKIYNVYRPAEELANSECINSFKLLPFIDEHTMLGSPDDGLTPAENKGVAGVIGEDIYYEEPYLRANLKIFSDQMGKDIDNGKKEVSAGYRCRYEITPGTWNGQQYDAIQREIRGNHVALVPEGRCGPDVAVLDQLKITFDAKELTAMTTKTLDEAMKENGELKAKLEAKDAELCAMKEKMAGDNDMDRPGAKDAAEEEEEKKKKEAEDKAAKDAEEEEKKKEKEGMDAAIKKSVDTQVSAILADRSKAQDLAARLIPHIGTFDHKDKTLTEVAEYGVQKLELQGVPKGHEVTALNAHLHGKSTAASPGFKHAMDATGNTDGDPALKAYLSE